MNRLEFTRKALTWYPQTRVVCARLVLAGCLSLMSYCSLAQGVEVPDAAAPAGLAPDPITVFQAGVRLFEDGFYKQAKTAFEDWVEENPEHSIKGRVQEYVLWSGAEQAVQDQDFSMASQYYSQLLRDFPKSNQRLEYAFGEAWSRFQMRQYGRVAELLTNPNAPFPMASIQTETSGDPKATALRLKGKLLLAETWLKLEEFEKSKSVLNAIPDWSLSNELVWRLEFLLTQLLLAEGELMEATQSATRLLAWAGTTESEDWIAESVALKGDVLRANGQMEEALKTYQENLKPKTPERRRREARLKIIELNLLQERPQTVIEMLEEMLISSGSDASVDVVHLTLGEIYLKRYFGDEKLKQQVPASNPGDLLVSARRHLETLLKSFPQSTYRGRARYALGWCLWEQGEYSQCLAAFESSASLLEKSVEQAESVFKTADLLLRADKAKEALLKYTSLIRDYENYEQVREKLFDQALYQMLRAAIAADDLESATTAVQRLLVQYPHGPLVERSRLLFGQRLVHVGRTSDARKVFEQMLGQFGDFPLKPEVSLALAHTYEQEGDWQLALKAYESWLQTYFAHPDRPKAEYARAWVNDRLGNDEEALAQFQQFVIQHDGHALTPRARNWIGDYYFNGQDFEQAEAHYQSVAEDLKQTSPKQAAGARLMMAKCRFFMSDYEGVITTPDLWNPFTKKEAGMTAFEALEALGKDFAGETLLCLGDAYFERAIQSNPPNKEEIKIAISRYLNVPSIFMPNRWQAKAWGRYGDLHYFLGEDYAEALKGYNQAIRSEGLSISMLSQLDVSIGRVKERMAESVTGPGRRQLLNEALEHYLTVVYMKNLPRGVTPDAFWVREAGVHAMKIFEITKDWEHAEKFSNYLTELLPASGDEWLQMMNQWKDQLPMEKTSLPKP